MVRAFTAFVFALTLAATAFAGDTNFESRVVVQTGNPPTCSNATGDGALCIETDIELLDDMFVGDDATITGLMTIGETLAITGDLTLSGGTGALTFSAASTVVLADASATSLLIGPAGYLGLITIDTTDDGEEVNIVGKSAVSVFRIDSGFLTADEQAVLTAGFSSPVTGADVITLTGNAPTITLADNKAAALAIKTAGTSADFIVIDTLTGAEELTLKGASAGVSTFRVDVGKAVFDEQVQLDAGFTSAVTGADAVTLTGAAPTMTLKDNESAAFAINSSGTSAFFVIDTTTDNEELTLTGAAVGTSTFRIAQGIATFDEPPTFSAGAALALHEIRFCGNGFNGSDDHFMGPTPYDDTEADMVTGGAGCDGLDANTAAGADELPPVAIDMAYKPVAMVCSGKCTGTSTANDAVTYALYDDTAAVAGMTCAASAWAADNTPTQCTVQDSTPETVAAGSLVAIQMVGSDDACSEGGDDFECFLYVAF
jgi:hypothetical protein